MDSFFGQAGCLANRAPGRRTSGPSAEFDLRHAERPISSGDICIRLHGDTNRRQLAARILQLQRPRRHVLDQRIAQGRGALRRSQIVPAGRASNFAGAFFRFAR